MSRAKLVSCADRLDVGMRGVRHDDKIFALSFWGVEVGEIRRLFWQYCLDA